MGYYTKFEIIADDEVIKHMEESVGEFVWGERLDGEGDPPCLYSKWYSWEEDMLSVSKHFPEHLIEVRGSGEEGDDIWLAKFKGGKQVYNQEFYWSMLEEENE